MNGKVTVLYSSKPEEMNTVAKIIYVQQNTFWVHN